VLPSMKGDAMLEQGSIYIQKVLQSAATGTGNGTAVNCTDLSKGAFKIITLQVAGISGDTITWEATIDGTNWAAFSVTNLGTAAAATTATANGIYSADVTGIVQFRARISTYSAGTITVTGILTSR